MNLKVSIPSNGSIQFLQYPSNRCWKEDSFGLNPLKRVNSILTISRGFGVPIEVLEGLNPLKRVNSILTLRLAVYRKQRRNKSLNPLKRVNSILTSRVYDWTRSY